MIRHSARTIGMVFLLLAWGMAILDGTRSIAADKLTWTTLETAMNSQFPTQFSTWPDSIRQWAHPLVWDPALSTLLKVPLVPLLFVCATLLLVLGRRRHDTLLPEATMS